MRSLVALLLPLLGAACSVGRAGDEAGADRLAALETRPLELPVRSAEPGVEPRPPRAEPLAHDLPDVTLHLAMSLEGPDGALRRGSVLHVRRTGTAIHLHDRHAGEEWLFRRNPVDPARVHAERVLHSHRLVLRYSDSDLRDEGLPCDFGPLALLGVDSELLASLLPDGRERQEHGTTLRCLAARDGGLEVWWSDELRLPVRTTWVTADGRRMVQEVLGLSRRVDAATLRDPGIRLPRYRRVDLCDWREANCACGGSHRPTLSGWARTR